MRTDRRLLAELSGSPSYPVTLCLIGLATAATLVAQATLLAQIIDGVAVHKKQLSEIDGELIALGALTAMRGLLTGGFELSGRLVAVRIMARLRRRLTERFLLQSPLTLIRERPGELATAAVQGVDALESYFAGFLPQVVLSAVVPVAVLIWTVPLEPVSAAIFAITIPLLVVFMVLIGKGAAATTKRRWRTLALLGAHFFDVVRGLPTLRIYRREHSQAETLADVGERFRRETMATLKIAFLSALVLELAAMIGTAMVATTIGIKLTEGSLELSAGLTVLLLAPELYSPLRQVGQQFHASADGLATAERIFTLLDEPVQTCRRVAGKAGPVPDPSREALQLEELYYRYPAREKDVLSRANLTVEPGRITALVGPSGSGKSTVAALILRLIEPGSGRILCGKTDLLDLDVGRWRRQIVWVPQRPHIFSGTVAENIAFNAPNVSRERVLLAAEQACSREFVEQLRDGFDTVVGAGGRLLSAGQCRRIALARAFASDAPLVVLDEPTAHLDDQAALRVEQAIRQLTPERTVLVIAHRVELAGQADSRWTVKDGSIASEAALPKDEATALGVKV